MGNNEIAVIIFKKTIVNQGRGALGGLFKDCTELNEVEVRKDTNPKVCMTQLLKKYPCLEDVRRLAVTYDGLGHEIGIIHRFDFTKDVEPTSIHEYDDCYIKFYKDFTDLIAFDNGIKTTEDLLRLIGGTMEVRDNVDYINTDTISICRALGIYHNQLPNKVNKEDYRPITIASSDLKAMFFDSLDMYALNLVLGNFGISLEPHVHTWDTPFQWGLVIHENDEKEPVWYDHRIVMDSPSTMSDISLSIDEINYNLTLLPEVLVNDNFAIFGNAYGMSTNVVKCSCPLTSQFTTDVNSFYDNAYDRSIVVSSCNNNIYDAEIYVAGNTPCDKKSPAYEQFMSKLGGITVKLSILRDLGFSRLATYAKIGKDNTPVANILTTVDKSSRPISSYQILSDFDDYARELARVISTYNNSEDNHKIYEDNGQLMVFHGESASDIHPLNFMAAFQHMSRVMEATINGVDIPYASLMRMPVTEFKEEKDNRKIYILGGRFVVESTSRNKGGR